MWEQTESLVRPTRRWPFSALFAWNLNANSAVVLGARVTIDVPTAVITLVSFAVLWRDDPLCFLLLLAR